MSYDFSSDGIQIKGDDSFHVMRFVDKDEWVLLRLRKGTSYQCGTFVSPDEARAFAHALGLTITRHNQDQICSAKVIADKILKAIRDITGTKGSNGND